MRVMVMVKATKKSETGELPSPQLLADMGAFNEQLVKAGVLVAGDGLAPSRAGKRVKLSGATKSKTVMDGPFAETKELVAGYWIWKVRSMDEALDWARRCPHPMPGEDAELELRPLLEPEDFAPGRLA